jgi:Flp pilus assembly pilin Flp
MEMKRFVKRFMRNKQAITPVLSHLLLTVVAVAVMAIATSATFVITTNLRNNMSERVMVEDVWFHNATGTVDVYVHNIGKVSIEVSAVYVNHVRQPFSEPFRLGLNGHDWLSIDCDWNSGDVYHIDLVTSRGTHVAGYYKAP